MSCNFQLLLSSSNKQQVLDLKSAYHFLTSSEMMGDKFKVICFTKKSDQIYVPPGFESII